MPAGGDDGAHSGGGDEEGFAAHGAEEPFPKEGAFDDFASLDGVEGTVEGEGFHGFSTGLVGATGPRVAGGGAGVLVALIIAGLGFGVGPFGATVSTSTRS